MTHPYTPHKIAELAQSLCHSWATCSPWILQMKTLADLGGRGGPQPPSPLVQKHMRQSGETRNRQIITIISRILLQVKQIRQKLSFHCKRQFLLVDNPLSWPDSHRPRIRDFRAALTDPVSVAYDHRLLSVDLFVYLSISQQLLNRFW